jgi:hypothetical protein
MTNSNFLANPSDVSDVGSSTQSPGGGYPENPSDAARTNDDIAKGLPSTSDFFSNGVQLMSPCHLCGRAFSDTPGMGIGGPSIQEHIQSHNESPFMREGSDFSDNDYEV